MRVALSLTWVLVAAIPLRAADSTGVEFFETKIRPVLATRCFACHSSQAPKVQGGLQLDSEAALRKGGNSGVVINTAEPDASLLLHAIRYTDQNLRMPPGKALPPENVADFETWIRAGAPMPADAPTIAKVDPRRKFWSFQAPKEQIVPTVQHPQWARNAIDNFVIAKLEEKGLAPSAPADKRTLIRRVTFDLTGLPPTAAEIEAFVSDTSPTAYEKLVDRLLASPRYGERWARYWLDVARYSDARNVGDRFAFSYTYRDWVIRALNRDVPYDRFVQLQLAADQMPDHTRGDLAALGYLSLGREFPKSFPETVDDRIDTVARGMLGLTVACARCHDHKYDPIPTKDYYSFYSIFSNVREPKELPLLAVSSHQTRLDQTWHPRLDRIRQTDADYRTRRDAEMIKFFKTQIGDYLIAVRDSRTMSNTDIEELVRNRQLNLHVLRRWRVHLSKNDPVFEMWTALAALPDSEFAARSKATVAAHAKANSAIGAAFQATTPASIKEAAALYQTVMLKYDGPDMRTGPEEALRLALRGPDAPVNVPVDQFELIYTEGDSNNTRNFKVRYETSRAVYAYEGGAPRAMAVEDVPSPTVAHVFVRGNANNPGVETPPHFLSCLSKGEPQVFTHGSGRLDLAEAITSRDNPLSARVIVNRVWMHHFGFGIVRSPSDFGLRGDPPTHPKLLDYLAVHFMDSGWSLKKLHRMILLSATYRQASADNSGARKIDPENLMLWRMNRRRLDIEALRDSMLAVSGQLELTSGGPPYLLTSQPVVARRTIYGFIERGRVPAFLSAFDFASPDTHAPLRYTTTVPQQALFLLNSSFIAEQARALAARAKGSIEALYLDTFGRPPTEHELEVGKRFIELASKESGPMTEESAWVYGRTDGKTFTPFRYFADDTWQQGTTGSATLKTTGGNPGDDSGQAIVRRWVSPVAGKIKIEGTLKHAQTAVPTGNGVHARIVSSRHGELASWTANGSSAETVLAGIAIEKGDIIDFIVDGRNDIENDNFTWAPKIALIGSDRVWDAAKDFRGPGAKPLGIWEQYAQVLLETNEFAFVD